MDRRDRDNRCEEVRVLQVSPGRPPGPRHRRRPGRRRGPCVVLPGWEP